MEKRVCFSIHVLSLALVAFCLQPATPWTLPPSAASIRHGCGETSAIALSARKKSKSKPSRKGGGGGGGFGTVAPKQPSQSQVAKRIVQQYGGTSASDITRGTQERINKAMADLPPHLQVAARLFQELQKWNAKLGTLSILDHAQKVSPAELDGARRAQEELHAIMEQHELTTDDLHNVFQQVTWDASADAKVARALMGSMSKDIGAKVDNACRIVAQAVGPNGICLDVGCGHGVLVPHLLQCGLKASQIYGVDLSPEMIRHAQEQHGTRRSAAGGSVTFEACDFQQYTSDDAPFDAIIFCSSLHDLPNCKRALAKACALLRKGAGKLVVVHPQGAAHVAKQHAANPVMVQEVLPDAQELRAMVESMDLQVEKEPAKSGSPQEQEEGYLAVLVRS